MVRAVLPHVDHLKTALPHQRPARPGNDEEVFVHLISSLNLQFLFTMGEVIEAIHIYDEHK
jgi:hypothetical protein